MTHRARGWLVAASLAFSTCAFAQNPLWTWTVDGYADQFPNRAAAEAFMRSQSPAHARLVPVRNSEQFGLATTDYFYAQMPPVLDDTTGTIRGGQLAPCAPDALQLIEVVGINACEAASGNNEQIENDLVAPGIELTRAYNSFTAAATTMGTGWTHNYEAHLVLRQDGLLEGLVRPDGKQEGMYLNGPDFFVSTAATGLVARFVFGEWRVYHDDGAFEVYDTTGRLLRIDDHGQVTTLAYIDGLLTSVTGPGGHTIRLFYMGELLTRVFDPAGNSVAYEYDSANNLIKVTNTDFSTREYFYEKNGLPHHLTGINHEEGVRFASFDYDESGRLTFTERAGVTHRFWLAYADDSTTVIDQNGTPQTLTFSNDGRSRRTLSHMRAGLTRKATFNDAGQDPQRRTKSLRKESLPAVLTVFDHDPFHVNMVTEAYGLQEHRETRREFLNPETDLPLAVYEPRRTTRFSYDQAGRVLTRSVYDNSSTVPRTWTYAYDAQGRLRLEDGPRTDVFDGTNYDYYPCMHGNECGQLRAVTNAMGLMTIYEEYNPNGLPTLITDPNGTRTRLAYDSRQRLVTRTIAIGTSIAETTLYEYWQTGPLSKVTNPDGSFLEYEYDGALRLVGISDGEGNRIAYTVDHMGNRTADNTYDTGMVVTRMHTRVFNELNQLYKDVNAAGTFDVTTTYDRNPEGQVFAVRAPLGRVRFFLYDPLGRTVVAQDPLGNGTTYLYNDTDDAVMITGPRALFTINVYNGFDELIRRQTPDSGLTTNTYDSAGNLSTSRDARNATVTYTYDPLNRLRTAAYTGPITDPTITYTYDVGLAPNQKGRLTNAGDSTNTTKWSYDPKGRVFSKLQTVGTFSAAVNYAYDPAGRVSTIFMPSGTQIVYLRGPDQRIWGIRSPGAIGNILDLVTYAPFGGVTGWRWGNGTIAKRSYDLDGNVDAVDDVWQVGLRYDPAGRLTNVDGGQSLIMEYDQNDRLTRYLNTATGQTFSTYQYDASGNRVRAVTGGSTQTLTVRSNSNQLMTVANTGSPMRNYVYDPAGNLLSNGPTVFAYNARGLVKSSMGDTGTWNYLYNAQGQRVKKFTTSGNGTMFVYDEAGHLIGEYTPSGALIEETVWLDDIPVATLRPKTGGGIEIFYVHTDHLNAPRRVTKPSNNSVVWSSTSTAFGLATTSGTAGFVYNLRTNGEYFDAETTTHSIDGRTYDPLIGRYLQVNPLAPKDGTSPYSYSRNNPLAVTDPRCMGRCPR